MPDLTWQKSSYSGSGNCIEIARDGDRVLIRDLTPKPWGSQFNAIVFAPVAAWEAFLAGVKAGEFDQPEQETTA